MTSKEEQTAVEPTESTLDLNFDGGQHEKEYGASRSVYGSSDNCDAEEAVTKEQMKEESDPTTCSAICYTNTNGKFFGYAAIPMIFFTCCIFVVHLVIFMHGYRWSRHSTTYALELREQEEETKQEKGWINVHALLGLTVAALASFQVITAVRFGLVSNKRRQLLAWAHGLSGRVTFFLWSTCAFLGVMVVLLTKRGGGEEWDVRRIYLVCIYLSVFVGTFGNMALGIYAVTGKDKSKRDFFLHKSAMFFALNWVLSSSFDEVVMNVVQLVYSHCPVGNVGLTYSAFLGEALQFVSFVATAWWFDHAIFRGNLVRVNLLVWFVRTLSFGIALKFVVADESNYSPEDCFAPEAPEL